MSELVRITIYATPELKAQLEQVARENKPKTTISALGSMFLEQGLKDYKNKYHGDTRTVIVPRREQE